MKYLSYTFQVIGIESACDYIDGVPRVQLRIDQADSMFRNIRLPWHGELPPLDARGLLAGGLVEPAIESANDRRAE